MVPVSLPRCAWILQTAGPRGWKWLLVPQVPRPSPGSTPCAKWGAFEVLKRQRARRGLITK